MTNMTQGQIVDAVGGELVESATNELVKTAVTVIPPAEALVKSKQWEPIKLQILKAAETAALVTVKTPQDRATAEVWARLLKPVVSKLDKKRLDLKRAIKERLLDPLDNLMNPVIKTGMDAVNRLDNEIRSFDAVLIEQRREEQRLLDAAAKRSLQAQNAAVAQGKVARKEIVAEVAAKPDVIESDNSCYWRLTYTVVDPNLVPKNVEFKGQTRPVCSPDAALINGVVRDLEGDFAKEQKGYSDVPQVIPGVKIEWKQTFRRA